eukprot:Amastigsp_a176505_14.p4 type:complete len:130 gc:universal Amastigsp_a176505_14:203-592(+)
MMVFSLPTSIRLAWPRSCSCTASSFRPTSSEITVPPVRIAMSSSMALRRSPKPGAFTAVVFRMPRMLFTTSVASASPSTSSAMISKGRPALATCSRVGSRSRMLEIFLSCNNTKGLSSNAIWRSGLLMK